MYGTIVTASARPTLLLDTKDFRSVPDPNTDAHVFGPPGSGSTSQWKKNLDSFCFVTSYGLDIFEK
jgi:hypothetical protein